MSLLSQKALLEAARTHIAPLNRPAAVVFHGHITALAVARSLGRRGVPVIVLDHSPDGLAPASRHVAAAGLCPNVLDDEQGFIDYLLALGEALGRPAVLYPTNDEWVLAVNRHRAALDRRFLIPFAGEEVVEPVLDKIQLYRTAERLSIPIPRTWYPSEVDLRTLARQLPYPCIVKPAEQRPFYAAFGAKAWRIESPAAFVEAVERAAGHALVAQEIVGSGLADFYSACSYVGLDGEAHGSFVGRKLEQYPPDFGTGCLVASEGPASIAAQGVQVLKAFGYHGISEIEFIYDARDGEHKLLDVNTRVWKWIGLPIAAGVDLPWLAYADATGVPERAGAPREGLVWTHARDLIELRLAGLGKESAHYLPESVWADLLSGTGEQIVDAVIDLADPGPAARMIERLLNPRPYHCAC